MARTYTGDLLAIHDVDASKVRQMVRDLMERGSYCFPPINIRRTESGVLIVVDGVHRAVAACITNTPASYEEVNENELLTDSDVRRMNLYSIASLAASCGA